MDYITKFKNHSTPENSLTLSWLGQAGFLIRNSKGKVIALDPYLSDLVEKLEGEKRLMMALFEPEEFTPDLVLCSHEHADHLDIDTLPVWIEKSVPIYTNTGSKTFLESHGISTSTVHTLEVGDEVDVDGFHIKATYAFHGDATPTAIGFLIESEGVKIYYTGDGSYQRIHMGKLRDEEIDVLIAPINGEYGNMNSNDVAMLSNLIKPRMTIPCHFGTFARHGGDPYMFRLAMKELSPEGRGYIMTQGEILDIYPSI